MNLKSSWLLEPFMLNDWEKLRQKQREVSTLWAPPQCSGASTWAPKSPGPRLCPGPWAPPP